MNLLNRVLTDIWEHLYATIDFTIVVVVIASGYILARNPITRAILNKSKTFRVAVVSLFVGGLYSYFAGIDVGVFIASWVFAFGFHTIAIKWIDNKFKTTNPEIKPPQKTTNPEIKPPRKK
jgi:hypothetical protein